MKQVCLVLTFLAVMLIRETFLLARGVPRQPVSRHHTPHGLTDLEPWIRHYCHVGTQMPRLSLGQARGG